MQVPVAAVRFGAPGGVHPPQAAVVTEAQDPLADVPQVLFAVTK